MNFLDEFIYFLKKYIINKSGRYHIRRNNAPFEIMLSKDEGIMCMVEEADSYADFNKCKLPDFFVKSLLKGKYFFVVGFH